MAGFDYISEMNLSRLPSVGHDTGVVALAEDAQKVLSHTLLVAHGLAGNHLRFCAQTHALTVAAQAGRKVAVAAGDVATSSSAIKKIFVTQNQKYEYFSRSR